MEEEQSSELQWTEMIAWYSLFHDSLVREVDSSRPKSTRFRLNIWEEESSELQWMEMIAWYSLFHDSLVREVDSS